MVLALLLFSLQAAPDKETVRIPDSTVSFDLVRVPATDGLRPFLMGATEVTWAEFNTYYGTRRDKALDGVTRPSRGTEFFNCLGIPAHFEALRRPVTNVRWHTAVAYCEWLSLKTGRTFRLPTEREWVVAARAGGGDEGWHRGNSGKTTHEVGERKPNALGLYDLLGNVWEYCLEFDGSSEFRPVLRGGSWASPAADGAVGGRRKVTQDWFEPDPNRPRSMWWLYSGFAEQGFRVVCLPDAAGAKEREAAAKRIDVRIVKSTDVEVRTASSRDFFCRVRAAVTNNTGQDLDELELRVFYRTPQGRPHLIDIGSWERPTFAHCWPVLASSVQENPSFPLKSKVTRTFEVDVPRSFDDVSEVDPDGFGAEVVSLTFAREEKK